MQQLRAWRETILREVAVRRDRIRSGSSLCVGALTFLALLSAAPANAAQDYSIGPITYSKTINGVSVSLPARATFGVGLNGLKAHVEATVYGDLVDLQAKIGSIVDTFALPTDNCRSFSANNPVVSIPRKELTFRDGKGLFSIGGTVAVWDCRENPVPNSRVDWEIRKVGLGIKTKVPVVHTWPGDPIKNKLLSQPFDADLPFDLVRADQNSVILNLGSPNVELKGQFVTVTKGLLQIAGININEKAESALRSAVDPQSLLLTLPEEIRVLGLGIDGARFIDSGGHLTAVIDLSGDVSASSVVQLMALIKKPK